MNTIIVVAFLTITVYIVIKIGTKARNIAKDIPEEKIEHKDEEEQTTKTAAEILKAKYEEERKNNS